MSIEEIKSSVRAHMDAWNNKDQQSFEDLFAPGYVHHDPAQPDVTDLTGFKLFALGIWSAFPDFFGTIDHLVAEGDVVAKRFTLTGTHLGRFAGVPATGARMSITGIAFYRFEGGKIAETWWNYDMMSLMRQIGAVPLPA